MLCKTKFTQKTLMALKSSSYFLQTYKSLEIHNLKITISNILNIIMCSNNDEVKIGKKYWSIVKIGIYSLVTTYVKLENKWLKTNKLLLLSSSMLTKKRKKN